MKPTSLLAVVLCVFAVGIFVVGGERFILWTRCKLWHSAGEGTVTVDGRTFPIPDEWCPIDADGVTLTNVPTSRGEAPITVLIAPLPESLIERLQELPQEMTILGESLVLAEERSKHESSGPSGTRMVYRRTRGEAKGESYVAWVFPEKGVMISSFRVSAGKERMFDDLVARLVGD